MNVGTRAEACQSRTSSVAQPQCQLLRPPPARRRSTLPPMSFSDRALRTNGLRCSCWTTGRPVGVMVDCDRRFLERQGASLRSGCRAGRGLLLRLNNTADFPVAYLAAIAADLIPVPTSASLTVPEITAIANDLDPSLILSAPGVALPDPLSCPVLSLNDLRALADSPPLEPILGDPNRPAYIVYTSGTGGRARGVIHAHRAIWARRMMWDGWYGLTREDRLLHAGAFNWTYTLGTGLLDPWAVGANGADPSRRNTCDHPARSAARAPRHDLRRRSGGLPPDVARRYPADARPAPRLVSRRKTTRCHTRALAGRHRHRNSRGLRNVRVFYFHFRLPDATRPTRNAGISPIRSAYCNPERWRTRTT